MNRIIKSVTPRDLCINRDDWQNSIFVHLAIFLNPVLAGRLPKALEHSQAGTWERG
ncbi:hypothetical protein MNB_SUP05-SYMBIONT-4-562 [hydrothermal vent metagenome]|uniref:Uncharacterized protein n=1 Tax=hydrothermal vent metagenome TaxID=652676 RepID=A0A1W1DXD2_9ZZZZ